MSTNEQLLSAIDDLLDAAENFGLSEHPAVERVKAALNSHMAVPLRDAEKLKMWRHAEYRCGGGRYEYYLQGIEDAERTLAARWGVKLEGGKA